MNTTAFTRRLFLCLAGPLLATLVAACGGGGGDGGAAPQVPAPAPAPAPSPAATAALAVTVIDTQGRLLDGVTVSSAAASASSDTSGRATVNVPTGSEQTVRVAKDGFAEQIKVVNLASGTAAATLQAMLIAREAPLVIAAIEAGGSVTGRDGVKVTLPAGALVTSTGQAVTGAVQLHLTPVDVTQLDVGAFPGLFEGTPAGGTRSPIVSFGTAELVPQQGAQALNLAPGMTAEIELPLYANKHQNGVDVKAGDKIALWSLDTTTGLWTQEGEGTVVVSAGAPIGLALRATIAHFSWWNIDSITGRGFVNLTVNASGTTVPAGTSAEVEARVVAGTGPAWVAAARVTVGSTTRLQLPPDSTVRLTATIELGTNLCVGSVVVSAPANATVDATITATCVDVPVPRIVRPGPLSATNSSRDVSVQVLIDGPRADLLEVFAGDTLIAQFNAAIQVQPFFTAFFDSSTFAEGTHFLKARATRQGLSRDSEEVQVVVDRTLPRLLSLSPGAGTEVSQATVFTLVFDEPVNPLPFALTDAVKLAATPVNSSTPVEVPITATLSADGLLLTVQAQAALPLGNVASLTWGGLKDAATNPITGTVSATFAIDRSAFLLAQPQLFTEFGPPLAINGSGQLVAAWAEDDNNLRVGLHNGSNFVLFGAAADNPISNPVSIPNRNVGLPHYDLTLDATDRPHIAYRQVEAVANRILARRFNGTAWENLGPPFTGINDGDGRQPRLLIDPAGRPVIAFIRSLQVEVHRFDAASNTWLALGSPSGVGGPLDLNFDLALTPTGDPVVALVQGFFGNNATELRAARHNGTTWVALGAVLDSAPFTLSTPRIAGGANGPWIHYVKPSSVLRLLRFNGTDWEVNDVPRPVGDDAVQNPITLGLLDETPVIAYNGSSRGTLVTRFAGGSFDEAFPAIGRPSQLSIAIRNTPGGKAVFMGAQPTFGQLIVERLLFP